MPITRHFLGWDGPALARAAGALREWFQPSDGGWDLGRVIAVVPAQRAGRRLLELLVTQAEADDLALIPPRIVTTGALPEELYEAATPIAGDLDEHLAWIKAMRSVPADELAPLLPHPPAEDDLPGWWAFAIQLRRLRDDLAGHRMRFADVPRLSAQRGIDLRGEERWAVLDAIERAYLETLGKLGLSDRHTQRLDAISSLRCACEGPRHIVLIAAPDLNDVAAAMLRQLGDRVTALVMAPEAHADGFDDLGVLKADYWRTRHVDLRPEQVCFVGRGTDQATRVVQAISEAQTSLAASGETLSADQVTVGLGDEGFAGPVGRRLDLAGIESRHAAGTPTTQSRPALLLRALGRFMEEQRLDALAELLRHPDIEGCLQRDTDGETRDTIEDWLSLLDRYMTEHLQGRLTEEWLGESPRRDRLKAVHNRCVALLPYPPQKRMPLPAWSEPIAQALRTAYADVLLREHVPDEHQTAMALEQIADALREQGAQKEDLPTCPSVTAAQAIALTLRRLEEKVLPDERDTPAVELLGYLELPLDDAPVLAVTGMDEGHIPSSRTADALLPDSVRSALLMRDNVHRYARDLMLLNAITHSRPIVRLIAARRTDDGDPLKPSRLLLACDDETLVGRVSAYFDDPGEATAPAPPIRPGHTNRFLIPKPVVRPRPLDTLPVTAFKHYIACPYRFYLRYVLRLESLDDTAIEMDPMSFGSIAHDVLQQFGAGDVRDATEEKAITACLDDLLDTKLKARFGEDRRPVLRIQGEQLRQRLHAFARQQAQLARQGWRIMHVERDLRATITVDDEPFTIRGKVDRIDGHDTLGWRVYDYKTGESGYAPQKTHLIGRGEDRRWVDLQLPLYRDLCTQLGVTGDIQLGYFNLPKTPDKTGPSLAEWDEDLLASAAQTRDSIIRGLRAQEFWPPKDVPRFPDGLERVCADHAMEHGELVRLSAAQGGDA